MKYAQKTRQTSYTTKGWKEDKKTGNVFMPFTKNDHSKAFQRELDQSLFPAREVSVKELPDATWKSGGSSCPTDLIKSQIATTIAQLCDVLNWAEEKESKGKRVDFELNVLNEAHENLAKIMDLTVLYKRYSLEYGDFFSDRDGTKIIPSIREDLVNSLRRSGLEV